MSLESSLREFDRLSDRIRLHRQARRNAIVVVEGRSDANFTRRMLSCECDFFIAGNRQAVLMTARDISIFGMERIVCLVDRDFDAAVAEGKADGLAIVAYDGADLEAMLFLSEALRNLLAELGSDEKLSHFGGIAFLRSRVLDLALPIARLRYSNAMHGWGIVFDAIPLAGRMKISDPQIELEPLAKALYRASADTSATVQGLIKAASDDVALVCSDTGDPLFRGKDALAILGVYLRRIIGGLSHLESNESALSGILRLAADPEHIRQLPWYRRMSAILEPPDG